MEKLHITPQIVLITDSVMFRPTLFTVNCLLKHYEGKAKIHLWGDRLDDREWKLVDTLDHSNPKVSVERLSMTESDFVGARHVGIHVTTAAMGRLLIPQRLTGRVLYVDGDVLIKSDLSPIFNIDLGDKLIGAVRDFGVIRNHFRGKYPKQTSDSRTIELRTLLKSSAISEYVNSGVLLIDTDKIRQEPDIFNEMDDLQKASSWSLGDQDRINNLFAGKIHFLNPAWNASWGRSREQRFLSRKMNPTNEERRPISNKIIHFTGPNKPWKRKSYKFWKTYDRAIISYQRELKRFNEEFPKLAF